MAFLGTSVFWISVLASLVATSVVGFFGWWGVSNSIVKKLDRALNAKEVVGEIEASIKGTGSLIKSAKLRINSIDLITKDPTARALVESVFDEMNNANQKAHEQVQHLKGALNTFYKMGDN